MTGGWVSAVILVGCPFRGLWDHGWGCWSSVPLSRLGRCLVPPAQPCALHTAPGLRLPGPVGVPSAPRSPCHLSLCLVSPPINGSGAQVSEGPKEQPTPCCTPGPQLPQRGLSLRFPGRPRNPHLLQEPTGYTRLPSPQSLGYSDRKSVV